MSKIPARVIMKANKSKIENPNIHFTKKAFEQLDLIMKNDFTVIQKVIRLSITGKGCDGFLYALGFDTPHKDDFVIHSPQVSKPIHMDPFCAHYLQKGLIDYKFDTQTGEDGFLIYNEDQKKYQKKFWLDDKESLLPLTELE